MNTSPITINTRFIKRLQGHIDLCNDEMRLLRLGEHAQAADKPELLASVGAQLFKMSGGGVHSDASAFYTALALNRSQTTRAQAEKILSGISETGSELFRAKSLLALGTNMLAVHGKDQEAEEYYRDAGKQKHGSWAVALLIKSQEATLASLRERYKVALAGYRELLPLADYVGKRLPIYRLHLLNNLAVAHCDAGKLIEAEGYAREALASPLGHPEFHKTFDEIGARRDAAARRERLSQERRKAAARAELNALLITPELDRWQAAGLESVLNYARQVKPQ